MCAVHPNQTMRPPCASPSFTTFPSSPWVPSLSSLRRSPPSARSSPPLPLSSPSLHSPSLLPLFPSQSSNTMATVSHILDTRPANRAQSWSFLSKICTSARQQASSVPELSFLNHNTPAAPPSESGALSSAHDERRDCIEITPLRNETDSISPIILTLSRDRKCLFKGWSYMVRELLLVFQVGLCVCRGVTEYLKSWREAQRCFCVCVTEDLSGESPPEQMKTGKETVCVCECLRLRGGVCGGVCATGQECVSRNDNTQ